MGLEKCLNKEDIFAGINVDIKGDITERKQVEDPFKLMSEFEKAVSTISSRFVGVSGIDDSINVSLEDIGRLSIASRAYMFLFHKDKTTMGNTHEWCAKGVSPQIHDLQNLPSTMFPLLTAKLQKGEVIHIRDVSKMPPEAKTEMEKLGTMDIKSLLILPLCVGGELAGFIGFDNIIKTGRWSFESLALLRISSEIIGSALERKKVEGEIKQLKEFNEKIVQGLQEGVLMEDSAGQIIFANPRMVEMLGYSREELLDMNWWSFVAPDYRKKVEKETLKNSQGKKSRYEAVLDTKNGEEIPVLISATPMFENGGFRGVLSVITDISEIKHSEEKLMQKEMKYRIERGNIYFVKDKSFEKARDVFQDLLTCGFKGLIISRTPRPKLEEMFNSDIPIIWLSEKQYDKMTIPPNFFLIEKTIENYLERDRVLLLDRLDYLILKNGFAKTMEFIQKLSEMFFINKGILILSLDPEILDSKELRLLEKEGTEVKLKHEPDFPEDLYEILEYVYIQNKKGKKPAHKDVEGKFKITRTTARKRINKLKNLDIVRDGKKGKFKVLTLTEKGQSFF
ncbi:MAG: DUF835 domain-containing protein [Candidatus Hydrothermarchaeales archaeon]